MRIQKIFLSFICCFAFLLAGCEKDDICVDGDTPLLVIEFYDKDNPLTLKKVTNLRIIGKSEGNNPIIIDRTTVDVANIPLMVNSSFTNFEFIINSAGATTADETGNIDLLTFTYKVEENFISRACGFVANYADLNYDLPTEVGDGNWIDHIELVGPEIIQNETQTHVKIFH